MTMQQHWWDHPLSREIHGNLRQKESHLPVYYSQSPQLSSRRYLVDWLAVICDSQKLCMTARHLAVALLDFFMDRFDIAERQLHLVALGCLLVAAKFEEQEMKIPKSTEVNTYVPAPAPGYTALEYLQIELTVLDFFQWTIAFPTAAHFTDYFLTGSLLVTDYHGDAPISDFERTSEYLEKYSNYFLEISLQDHSYREYKPSQVAAASIAAARMCLNISPVWSKVMQELTEYTIHDLRPIIKPMLRTYELDEEAMNQDRVKGGGLPGTPVTPATPSSLGSACCMTPVTPASACPIPNITPDSGCSMTSGGDHRACPLPLPPPTFSMGGVGGSDNSIVVIADDEMDSYTSNMATTTMAPSDDSMMTGIMSGIHDNSTIVNMPNMEINNNVIKPSFPSVPCYSQNQYMHTSAYHKQSTTTYLPSTSNYLATVNRIS